MADYIIIKTPQEKREERQIKFSKHLLKKYYNFKKEKIEIDLGGSFKRLKEISKTQIIYQPEMPPIGVSYITPVAPSVEGYRPSISIEEQSVEVKGKTEYEIKKPEVKEEIKKPEKFEKKNSLLQFNNVELVSSVFTKIDGKTNYEVKEPEVDHIVLDKVNEILEKHVKKNRDVVTNKKFLEKIIKIASKRVGKELSQDSINKIKYYVLKENIGFSLIEPLILDKDITIIKCDGVNEPIKIDYKPNYKDVETNLRFRRKDELDNFVKYLGEKAKQKVNENNPILYATLSNIRIQATLGTGVIESKFSLNKL